MAEFTDAERLDILSGKLSVFPSVYVEVFLTEPRVYCSSCGKVFLASMEVEDDVCPGCRKPGCLSGVFMPGGGVPMFAGEANEEFEAEVAETATQMQAESGEVAAFNQPMPHEMADDEKYPTEPEFPWPVKDDLLVPVNDPESPGLPFDDPAFVVRWEVPIWTAKTPREAVEMAREIQLDPESQAPFFEVWQGDENGNIAGPKLADVNLDEAEDVADAEPEEGDREQG